MCSRQRDKERLLFDNEMKQELGLWEGSGIPVHLHPPDPPERERKEELREDRRRSLFVSGELGRGEEKQDRTAPTGTEAGGRRKRHVCLSTQTHTPTELVLHTHTAGTARRHTDTHRASIPERHPHTTL